MRRYVDEGGLPVRLPMIMCVCVSMYVFVKRVRVNTYVWLFSCECVPLYVSVCSFVCLCVYCVTIHLFSQESICLSPNLRVTYSAAKNKNAYISAYVYITYLSTEIPRSYT